MHPLKRAAQSWLPLVGQAPLMVPLAKLPALLPQALLEALLQVLMLVLLRVLLPRPMPGPQLAALLELQQELPPSSPPQGILPLTFRLPLPWLPPVLILAPLPTPVSALLASSPLLG